MKKYCLSLILFSSLLNAEDFNQGFNGDFSFGLEIKNVQSNISTLAGTDYLGSFSSKNSGTEGLPFIKLQFYYVGLADYNDMIALKNYNDRDKSNIALGYQKALSANYTASAFIISSLKEKVYANPYALTNREKTNLTKFGVKFNHSYELLPEQKIYGNYFIGKNIYDKENVPYSSLKREGYFHRLQAGFEHPYFNVNLNYDFNDANGKAQSYNKYGLGFELNIILTPDYTLNPKFSITKYDSLGTDPLFYTKQSGRIYKTNVKLIKNNLFNQYNLYGFANYDIEKRNSNISFYNETYQALLAGISFKF